MFLTLKMTCLGCFRIEEIRSNGNETGLKEGRRNRNRKLQRFPYMRLHAKLLQ